MARGNHAQKFEWMLTTSVLRGRSRKMLVRLTSASKPTATFLHQIKWSPSCVLSRRVVELWTVQPKALGPLQISYHDTVHHQAIPGRLVLLGISRKYTAVHYWYLEEEVRKENAGSQSRSFRISIDFTLFAMYILRREITYTQSLDHCTG